MKKIKKTKTGLTVTLGFAAVALLSVGFSAWVVNLDSSKDTGNVSVEVADTTTNTVKITTEMIDSKFRFDAKKDDDKGAITFSGDPETDGEDLSFSFWVKLEKTGSNGLIYFNLQENKVVSEEYDANYDLLEAMVGLNYIEAPFDFDGTKKTLLIGDEESIGSEFSTDDAAYDTYYDDNPDLPKVNVDWDEGSSRYKVTMHFRWGTFTGNKNPCLYDAPTEVEDAKTVLDHLKDNQTELEKEEIRLTISHTYTKN